ncbi:MAG TPA: hypothetical protein VF957_05375 [Bradyrhizobium sp.]
MPTINLPDNAHFPGKSVNSDETGFADFFSDQRAQSVLSPPGQLFEPGAHRDVAQRLQNGHDTAHVVFERRCAISGPHPPRRLPSEMVHMCTI